MAEEVEAEIEEEEEECPKCPPVGAPAWMATFGYLTYGIFRTHSVFCGI